MWVYVLTYAHTIFPFSIIFRQKFLSDCLQLLESFQASYPKSTFPPLPERGDFNLEEVLDSPYFFNWTTHIPTHTPKKEIQYSMFKIELTDRANQKFFTIMLFGLKGIWSSQNPVNPKHNIPSTGQWHLKPSPFTGLAFTIFHMGVHLFFVMLKLLEEASSAAGDTVVTIVHFLWEELVDSC